MGVGKATKTKVMETKVTKTKVMETKTKVMWTKLTRIKVTSTNQNRNQGDGQGYQGKNPRGGKYNPPQGGGV